MSRPFRQVDVFTSVRGMGNPVAVVFDADDLTVAEMQRFASWTNLSETTFVQTPTASEADYRVRIFTPAAELPFAGHPTIGTCHAWVERYGAEGRSNLIQQCEAGLVNLRNDDGRWAFVTPELTRSGPVAVDDRELLVKALGVAAADVVDMAWIDNGPGWVGVLLDDPSKVRNLAPIIDPRLPEVGVAAVAGPNSSEDAQLVVRAFFDAGGTREDPVTGSLNGSLAQWLIASRRIGDRYVASQGREIGRDGRIYVERDHQARIWVGGDAVTLVSGEVTIT